MKGTSEERGAKSHQNDIVLLRFLVKTRHDLFVAGDAISLDYR